MNSTTIPDWTSRGVLPPVDPARPTSGDDRSPYPVSIQEFVSRFNISDERRDILSSFLDFRKNLYNLGLIRGFQWVNGSFVEDIEKIEGRVPNDIDVVTFFYLPDGETEESIDEKIDRMLRREALNLRYSIDARFVIVNRDKPESLIRQSTYWYGLWSHRRDGEWKGYLQIDLNSIGDGIARNNLSGS